MDIHKMKANQVKWHLSKSIWEHTLQQNINIIKYIFNKRIQEGWDAAYIWKDFLDFFQEAITEMNVEEKEEEEGTYVKYIIKQVISAGTKETGNQEEVINTIYNVLQDHFIQLETIQNQEGFFKKILRKTIVFIKLMFFKIFK